MVLVTNRKVEQTAGANSRGTKFCTVATSIFVFSVWNLLHTTHPSRYYNFEVAPILRWNICAPPSSCMERSLSREANSCSVAQDIPCLSWHLKFNHRALKGLPLEPITRHKNPLNILKTYFFKHTLFTLCPNHA